MRRIFFWREGYTISLSDSLSRKTAQQIPVNFD